MKKRPFLVSSVSIVLLFIFSLISVDYLGRSSRRYGRAYAISDTKVQVYIVKNSTDLYHLWKRTGLNGRIILQMGRYLHLVPIIDETISKKLFLESGAKDVLGEYEKGLSYRNFLRLAMEGNVARGIYYVFPKDAYLERYKAASELSNLVPEFVFHQAGSKMIVTDGLPRIKETVVVNIDASFFRSSDVSRLVSDLKRSGLKVDLVTFCLSEDNLEVSDMERGRLMEAAGFFLEGRGDGRK